MDYGSPQQQESDPGHVTTEAPTKDTGDLYDWEVLSRNPSPAPERYVNPSRHDVMTSVALSHSSWCRTASYLHNPSIPGVA